MRAGAVPWTEAHRREALRRCHEIAAEIVGAGGDFFPHLAAGNVETLRHFRATLAGHALLDPARIEREVRRVRALAEGRLVRETVWAVRSKGGAVEWPMLTDARRWLREHAPKDATIVRVTRIRRAS